MSIKVVVATHVPCEMPTDKLYLPVHVGAELHPELPFVGDNTGDNISEKNNTFCELTGLYWAWKNLPDDYVGLVHYRRYFASPTARRRNSLDSVLAYAQAEELLKDYDGILPAPRHCHQR